LHWPLTSNNWILKNSAKRTILNRVYIVAKADALLQVTTTSGALSQNNIGAFPHIVMIAAYFFTERFLFLKDRRKPQWTDAAIYGDRVLVVPEYVDLRTF